MSDHYGHVVVHELFVWKPCFLVKQCCIISKRLLLLVNHDSSFIFWCHWWLVAHRLPRKDWRRNAELMLKLKRSRFICEIYGIFEDKSCYYEARSQQRLWVMVLGQWLLCVCWVVLNPLNNINTINTNRYQIRGIKYINVVGAWSTQLVLYDCCALDGACPITIGWRHSSCGMLTAGRAMARKHHHRRGWNPQPGMIGNTAQYYNQIMVNTNVLLMIILQ